MTDQSSKNLVFEIEELNRRLSSICQILHLISETPQVCEALEAEITILNGQLKRLKLLSR